MSDRAASALQALTEKIMSGDAFVSVLQELLVQHDAELAALKSSDPKRYAELIEALTEFFDAEQLSPFVEDT
jgi:hypothetical protein